MGNATVTTLAFKLIEIYEGKTQGQMKELREGGKEQDKEMKNMR